LQTSENLHVYVFEYRQLLGVFLEARQVRNWICQCCCEVYSTQITEPERYGCSSHCR